MNDSASSTCPICGAPLDPEAAGNCPRCLMRAAMQPTHPADAERQPPPIEAVSAAFPHLEIIELIGQGGMGAVFKARQPKLNRFVALKILPESLGRDPRFAERFAREGQLLARLNHPNIVAVHDFGQAENYFYLLMEFVDGVNLRQAMRAGRFTAAQALGIVPKICEALQYAHDEGVLHRDIKPENILLDARGRVKLADFGIAKFIGDVEAADLAASTTAPDDDAMTAQLTSASAALGTPNYMAPEQRDQPADVDHRADIYSLGVVFYEMLTGELPVGNFAPPSEKSASDPRVDEVVLRALEQERERRQQSAGEMQTQVEIIAASPDHRPREEVRAGGTPPRLLNTGTSYVSTPEQLATFDGQFLLFRSKSQMLLDDRQLSFARAGKTTVIPLAAIRDLSIGHYPRVMNPAGIDFISVTYDEGRQTKRLFFCPFEGLFGWPSHFNQFVAEWCDAIRDAVTAATGRVPGHTPAKQLGVPPGSKALYAMYLAPVLLGVPFAAVLLFEVLEASPTGGSDSLTKGPVAMVLILLVLGVSGSVVALGGWNWFTQRKWMPTDPPDGASASAVQKPSARGCRLGLTFLLALSFAALLAAVVLTGDLEKTVSRMPAIVEPAPSEPPRVEPRRLARSAGAITNVHAEKQKVTIEARLDGRQELRVFVGEESLGWSMAASTAGEVTATVEASSQIRLENGSLGIGFIIRADGNTTWVAMTPGGPVPFGKLEFREDKDMTAQDGTWTFADIRQADGLLVPVSVKVRRASAPLEKSSNKPAP